MFKLKGFVIIVLLLLGSMIAYAQSIYNLDSSVATTDNLFAPVTNPALIGTSNPRGLGFVQLYDNKELQDNYWIISNMDGLSYVYEYNNGVNFHNFAIGSEMFEPHVFRNLYFGSSYKWMNSKTNEGMFKSGIVYRPIDATSVAMTIDHPYKASPSYRFGLGIRPLALVPQVLGYRAEFSIDMPYNKDESGKYEMLKPTIGMNTQLIDGVKLGANYNLESETMMLGFSLSARKSEIGSIARLKEKDNYGLAYIHLTDESFKPFLGLTPKTWYQMNLKGNLVTYRAPKYKVGPFSIYDAKTTSIESVIKEINKAKDDPAIHGILLQNPSFSSSFGLMQELITAINEFKASGKQLAFYYDNISNGAYIFASSVADKIYLNPMGSVDLRGFAVKSPYLNEMLTALGIEVLNFRSHDYKTAGNMFSESEMTPAERIVYEELIGDIFNQAMAKMTSNRGDKFKKPINQIINEGPYWIPEEALEAGLVDELVYLDQLKDQLKVDFAYNKITKKLDDYKDYNWSKQKDNKIAVIYAQGNIVMGEGEVGQKIAHATTVKKIREARKNKSYKGIILRIDSGGGSAQASDIIWREIELAKSENNKKVVVSMAGVAGSGGYYIACNADRIVANPATITGSIGVIGLAFNAEKMYKKIKVNWSTVKFGDRSDIGAMDRAWRQEEKDLLSRLIDNSYDSFIGKVAKGRNMEKRDVHTVAQGRVWTGTQALERGLIDELGGLDEAVKQMREVASIKGKIKLVDATTGKEGISINMKSDPLSLVLPTQLIENLTREYKKVYDLWQDYEHDPILMMTPLIFDDQIN